MISLLALLPGILLPAFGGWLLLRLLEGHHPVLLRYERWTLGAVLGLTYSMFVVFIAHIVMGVPLSRLGFLAVLILSIAILFVLVRRQQLPMCAPAVHVQDSPPLSRIAKILWAVLLGWIVLRTLLASIDFLLLSPTYLDDSLDNWNLRGKVFFSTHTLTLPLPGEDPLISLHGIGSYPPALPLMKTWLAAVWGGWSEPLVNSIHLLWYIAALILLFAALRRMLSLPWAMLGTYILGSLPLFLMHGTNAYGDAFLAVHVFAAVSLLFFAFRTQDQHARWTFLKLSLIAAAILPFVKNEGLLVYLPPFLLLLVWQLLRNIRSDTGWWETVRGLALTLLVLLMVVGPWFAFKWSHGMTFGNAKSFTSLGIGWQENVLLSVAYNTLLEGNWLLLFPIFFLLLLWKWRSALFTYGTLTIFFLIVYIGQIGLYLFTGLSTEALQQTGYARGLIHIVPVIVFLGVLLLHEAAPPFLHALHREP